MLAGCSGLVPICLWHETCIGNWGSCCILHHLQHCLSGNRHGPSREVPYNMQGLM
jgi:hypothetical protein